MPTSPEAIDRFLNHIEPAPPRFKEKSPSWLIDFIYKIGGREPQFVGPKPRLTQLAGLTMALYAKQSLLYYAPRTGKTKIAYDWLAYLRATRRARTALIIAHAPIGVDEWVRQALIHSRLEIFALRSGLAALDQLLYAIDTEPDAIVTTWSTLQSIFTHKKQARKAGNQLKFDKSGNPVFKLYPDYPALRELASFFDAMVIDEIHRGSLDPNGLWFKIAAELGQHCGYRLGLTGTPFGRDPFQMWGQAFLIDDGATLSARYPFFQEAFGKIKYNHFNRSKSEFVFDDRKMPLLQAKLEHMSLSCSLREIQEVNIIYDTIELKMSAAQQRAYREVIDKFIKLNTGEITEIENVFVRLRQIASGYLPYKDPESGSQKIQEFFDCPKYAWLEEFADSLKGDGLKIVIFHEFTVTGRRICNTLKECKVSHRWIYGGDKKAERPEILKDFQERDLSCLVLNAATGGMSIDLSAADYLLFFESPTSVIIRQQAEMRPMARGDRVLIMDDLICAPVEQKILGFMKEGKDLLDALLKDRKLMEELR